MALSPIEITELYFRLSNAGDLTAIETLLHSHASYMSENTGEHRGKKNIMAMMKRFFAAHSLLKWHIESINQPETDTVEVHFTLIKENDSTPQIQLSGLEKIVVVDGKILSIEVFNK